MSRQVRSRRRWSVSGAARVIDRVINLLKWPVAILSLIALPGSALAMWDLLWQIVFAPGPLGPFLVGVILYAAAWYSMFRRPIFGTFLSTLEHELTHALFALLTLHPVTTVKATWRHGGHMMFRGEGNWLITISPYFFPTASLALVGLAALLPEPLRVWTDGLLGASMAYHVTSTLRETHGGQSDLAKVGLLFAVLFLPTANILSVGAVLSFAWGGPARLLEFFRAIV